MKAAILGTTNYHATMQQIAQNALQPKFLQITETDLQTVELPPVEKRFAEYADTIVKTFTSNNTLTDCNPRSPYLFLAWLLIGSDNKYRTSQYTENNHLQKQVATINLKIALGDNIMDNELIRTTLNAMVEEPMKAVYRIVEVANIATHSHRSIELEARFTIIIITTCVAKALNGFSPRLHSLSDFGNSNHHVMKSHEQIQQYLALKMQKWAYISDGEAGLNARQLLFDILDVGK